MRMEDIVAELIQKINSGEYSYEDAQMRVYYTEDDFFTFRFEEADLQYIYLWGIDLDTDLGERLEEYADDVDEYREIHVDEFISLMDIDIHSYEFISD